MSEFVRIVRVAVDLGLWYRNGEDRVAKNALPLLALLQRGPTQRDRSLLNDLNGRKPKKIRGAWTPSEPRKGCVPENALVGFDGAKGKTKSKSLLG